MLKRDDNILQKATSLNVLHNYFNGLQKLFSGISGLYPAKFLDFTF